MSGRRIRALLENKVITTDALVMAAGSLNTTRLLMRAAAKGRIPDMPDALGQGWGTNADRIYVWMNPSNVSARNRAVPWSMVVRTGTIRGPRLGWSTQDAARRMQVGS